MSIKNVIPVFLALFLGIFFACTAPGSSSGGSTGGTQNTKAATYGGFSANLNSMVPSGGHVNYSYMLSIYLTNRSTNNNINAATITVRCSYSYGASGNTVNKDLNATCTVTPNTGSTIYFTDTLGLTGTGWSISYSLLSVTITWDDGTSQVL